MYVLWHQTMAPELHRPDSTAVIDRFGGDLDDPSVEAFLVRLLLDGPLVWTGDDLADLAAERWSDLERGRGLSLPSRVDTALALLAARVLWDADRFDEARQQLARAVELLPGDESARRLEDGGTGDRLPHFDLRRLALGASDWLADETAPQSTP